MITNEQAVDTLIAMSRRWANDYTNTCSWVVMTSKFTQTYPTDTRKFKLDPQLTTVTGPKHLDTTAIATIKSD